MAVITASEQRYIGAAMKAASIADIVIRYTCKKSRMWNRKSGVKHV